MVVTQEDKSIELLDVDPQETEDDGAVVVLAWLIQRNSSRAIWWVHFWPTEQYSDIGGLDRQIQKLIEAVVLPTTQKDKFKNLRIHPPKSTYLKLAGQCVLGCVYFFNLLFGPTMNVKIRSCFNHFVISRSQLSTKLLGVTIRTRFTTGCPPNQLDTTIGLPAHIDSAGGLNPPLASNRTLFTGTSFSLATSPSIRSTSSTSLLNREPSSSSSPFTNSELPITLPSSSPNYTCVVVGSAGAAGFLTATARASNTRAWLSELVSSFSMPGSGWACGNGCGRIVMVVEVRPAGTASSTVLPSSFLVPLSQSL
ncbi:26S protease regulatory subunit 6a [Culex quinquefasciatus]|uniref:26S protease regulatory subunit 6a n=1 Tax=Culex quinquefasciatus TaxID=7176 RepID=B0X5S0_CULQU|nr:26S protease regulatory subunit 6a [Culex quinquefasciatus]|eukprot:XP_001864992.1 26S protease regulatory subunit 6a [Culex quinquefasciatus]